MTQAKKLAKSEDASRNRDLSPAAANEAAKEGFDRDYLIQAAILSIAAILIVAALSLGRSFFMPVLAATIVGISLSPLQKWAHSKGIPSTAIAFALVTVFFGLLWLVVTLVIGAITGWIDQAPTLEATIREKLSYLERPISAVRDFMKSMGGATAGDGQKVSIETGLTDIAQQAIGVLRPALTEFLVFFGTLLFFLAGLNRLRRQLIVYFDTREARLRVMHIWSDIEQNLIAYLGTVTVINVGLGAATALMLYVLGFSNTIALGALAFVLNYIPYIGPALFTAILALIGIVSYPTLGGALLPAALFVLITAIEGNFLTPGIIGRRLTLSPFVVFVSLAFWTWLWGPFGAFMATPLLIVGLVVLGYMFPRDEPELPK